MTVYGVDETEIGVAQGGLSISCTHGGWVGITTYMDMHQNLRVKSETLVAIGITGLDQSDDTIYTP